jgi:hypothetical protein
VADQPCVDSALVNVSNLGDLEWPLLEKYTFTSTGSAMFMIVSCPRGGATVRSHVLIFYGRKLLGTPEGP